MERNLRTGCGFCPVHFEVLVAAISALLLLLLLLPLCRCYNVFGMVKDDKEETVQLFPQNLNRLWMF